MMGKIHVLTLDNLHSDYFDIKENKITYKLSDNPNNLLKFDDNGKLSLNRQKMSNAEVIWEGYENRTDVELYANDYAIYTCILNNTDTLKTVVIGKKNSDVEYSRTSFHFDGISNTESLNFIENEDYNHSSENDSETFGYDRIKNFVFMDKGYSIKIIKIPDGYYVKRIILL